MAAASVASILRKCRTNSVEEDAISILIVWRAVHLSAIGKVTDEYTN
jgi:hypothetical protein